MTSNNHGYPSPVDPHDYVHDLSDHISRKPRDLNEGLEAGHRIRLPIPDVRFEQTYLSRVLTCLHVEQQIPGRAGDVNPPSSIDDPFTAATHVSPVITSSQQITRIDWGKLAWITVRDQVIMPLLQGMLWYVICHGMNWDLMASFSGVSLEPTIALSSAL